MTERLEPASASRTSWTRVSTRYVIIDALGFLVGGLIATAISFIPLLAFHWWLGAVPPSVVGLISLVNVVLAPRRVRAIGYVLRDDDLLYRRGLAWQRFVSVPYGRMQLVDITRSPLDRALGLSSLRFVTAAASSTEHIPGMRLGDAEHLRDRLIALAETRRAGL